jgi:hypothetical protein
MMNAQIAAFGLVCATAPFARADLAPFPSVGSETVWRADDFSAPGGAKAEVLGAPKIIRDNAGSYALFNGRTDAFVIPLVPLAGLRAFTVEVLLNPDPAGPQAQRFLHMEDGGGRRLTMEIRLTAAGRWALDAFLLSGSSRRALLDEKLLHTSGGWHWVALRYDGRTMESFVDGRKELDGRVDFTPMESGRTAIGARLNRIFWYKGAIRKIIVHPVALAAPSLESNGGSP